MIGGLKPYPDIKDSGVPEIGMLPSHWEVSSLNRLGRISKGNGGSKEDEVAAGILDAIDMDSYRVEKQASVRIQLPDADVEIEPVPTSAGGQRPEPELDRLSNILRTFNELFGNVEFTDEDRVKKLITEDIPAKVSADPAYQNARKNSDKQNARIEHDKALRRAMVSVLKTDTELYRLFTDNESFKKWLQDAVFSVTYEESG